MPTTNELSTNQLREALQLSEQIESLQQRLSSLIGGTGASPTTGGVPKSTRRKMSPATIARMRIAQQARWANKKGSPAKPAAEAKATPATQKKKRKLTPEGRARLAAAMKARWAARKKGASS